VGVRPEKLTISASKVLEGTKVGDSIAVNGACLTVTSLQGGSFSVDVVPETMRRTNFGLLRPGDPINLERALQLGERMGGHLVQGHVDCTGRVVSLVPEKGAVLMTISPPTDIMLYLVEKGFIAVDGVSLTVVGIDASSFTVSLIPLTREQTNLGSRKPGDIVNLEVDVMGKYVERLLRRVGGITPEFLAKHGFL